MCVYVHVYSGYIYTQFLRLKVKCSVYVETILEFEKKKGHLPAYSGCHPTVTKVKTEL